MTRTTRFLTVALTLGLGLALPACSSKSAAKRDAAPGTPEAGTNSAGLVSPPTSNDVRRFGLLVKPAPTPPPLQRVLCPEDATGHEAALNAADRYYEAAELHKALACAELAAEFAPQAIEAHHLRGAALATMGHLPEAQLAFAMALALDPDDPETLAAVADFYINVVQPRGRDQLVLGLEYARRGSERASTRRRSDRRLRARLSLLVGAGLNDLGSADLALQPIEEALLLSPRWLEAEHERGVALFNLCRFKDAQEAFSRVVAAAPTDPYASYYLGLIAEREGDGTSAANLFATARKSAPHEYVEPVPMSESEFQAELEKAIGELSSADRKILSAVKLEAVDLPDATDLRAVDPPFSPTIMGLYRGLPVGAEAGSEEPKATSDALSVKAGTIPPRAIVLYRKNLARSARSRAELDAQIRRTLLHELGHAKGLDEDDLRRIGLD